MRSRLILPLLALCLAASAVFAQDTGRLEGRLVAADGRPVVGATVTIEGREESTDTDEKGAFMFRKLPPGRYTLRFRLVTRRASEPEVQVRTGETTRLEKTVEWDVALLETVTVVSPSRREEPLMEAAAAVSRVPETTLRLHAADGRIPQLLEFTPGVEITQGDISSYNVNARGFNDTANTRLEVRVDGRKFRVATLGVLAWERLAFALEDIEDLEFMRGPSSALYGANAVGGVVHLRTRAPRDSQGGTVRLAAGELATRNLDVRWAGALGNDWYIKLLGSHRESRDFLEPRVTSSEYSSLCPLGGFGDCLLPEFVPPGQAGPEALSGSVRVDRELGDGGRLTLEGGKYDGEGVLFQTGLGRIQLLDDNLSWGRVAWSDAHWDAFVSFTESRGTGLVLATGGSSRDKSNDTQARLQTNRILSGGRIRLVAGAETQRIHPIEGVSTVDPATGERVRVEDLAVFSQADWEVTSRIKLVVAGRIDESAYDDLQFSPKLGLVFQPAPAQAWRFTVNRAYRAPFINARFLNFEIGLPDPGVAALAAFCMDQGVDCGLDGVAPRAVGNNSLEVEESLTFEIGYRGLLSKQVMLSVEAYLSRIDSFFYNNLLPQLGTPLGRLNTDFGPWIGPPEAESTAVMDPGDCPEPGFPGGTVSDCVRFAEPSLSNLYDGSAALIALSFPSLGKVEARGVDLGLDYQIDDQWSLAFTYSWFDAEPRDRIPGFEGFPPANTPRHMLTLGTGYSNQRLDARLAMRWVEGFRWIGGLYQGPVRSYATVDLDAGYAMDQNWRVGISVSNLLDDRHYELFGGNLLGRRALASVTYSW